MTSNQGLNQDPPGSLVYIDSDNIEDAPGDAWGLLSIHLVMLAILLGTQQAIHQAIHQVVHQVISLEIAFVLHCINQSPSLITP